MSSSAYIGSSLDDLLAETADLAEVEDIAIKRVVARQVADAMKQQNIGKAAMARRMNLSRAQVGRLLEPENPSVTLRTLDHAARAVGRRLHLELVQAHSRGAALPTAATASGTDNRVS